MTARSSSERFSGKAGAARLWATWLVGPVAWAAHENVTYWLSTWMCDTGNRWMFHAATVIGLAAATGAAVAARRYWRAAGDDPPDRPLRTVERIRFQAMSGLIISAASALGIAVEGFPNFVLDPCIGIP